MIITYVCRNCLCYSQKKNKYPKVITKLLLFLSGFKTSHKCDEYMTGIADIISISYQEKNNNV